MTLPPGHIDFGPEIAPGSIPLDYAPQDEADWLWAIQDPVWRIASGRLYTIMTKGDEHQEGSVMPFVPNAAQRDFLVHHHNRSCILKVRQRGFTTLISLMWLDYSYFHPNVRCGVVAHKLDDAKSIFRDKIKFAYERMPEVVRALNPLKRESAEELLFANNSAIRVSTSMRSGTIHRLHVSELGKIAAHEPMKAREIVTGSLPAVPKDGVAIIESTAEGQEGEFYEIAKRAQARAEIDKPLSIREWKFHFYPWWDADEYQVSPTGVPMSAEDHAYFDQIEQAMGCRISLPRRAWYVATRDFEFGGDQEKMWQEYPSTPDECWQQSTEGTFLHRQLAAARKDGRIGVVPPVSHVPVQTFWDIGAGDGTAIWLMQHVGAQERFIGFIEGWSEGYEHFVKELRDRGHLYGAMYLPHDATHERQGRNGVSSALDALQELAPDWDWIVVPRVQDFTHGIQLLRQRLSAAWFDEDACKEGLRHLALYRKKWNARVGAYSEEPEKLTGHSEAADALRQWAQGYDPSFAHTRGRAERDRMRRAQGRRPRGNIRPGMVA